MVSIALPVRCDILIVDDRSTDGTTQLIEARAESDGQIRLIVRNSSLGIGSAHKLALLYAHRAGYTRRVSLDADLSHDPANVPRLLAALDAGADVAIASWFASGGRLDCRGWRLFLSKNANRFARSLLQVPLFGYATFFRAAKLDRTPLGRVEGITGRGYGFFLNVSSGSRVKDLLLPKFPFISAIAVAPKPKFRVLKLLRGVANLLVLTVDRRRAKRSALPEVACPAYGGHYRVTMRSSELWCLECLATDQSRSFNPDLTIERGAAGEVTERTSL
jgi:dolichol-phosphate mannosyltransferase